MASGVEFLVGSECGGNRPLGSTVLAAGSAIGGEERLFCWLFWRLASVARANTHAVAGFVFVTIACFISNVIAKYVGGIEIEQVY